MFRTADQVAMGLLGLVLAGVALLFTRPRLRVGPAGLRPLHLVTSSFPGPMRSCAAFPPGARRGRGFSAPYTTNTSR